MTPQAAQAAASRSAVPARLSNRRRSAKSRVPASVPGRKRRRLRRPEVRRLRPGFRKWRRRRQRTAAKPGMARSAERTAEHAAEQPASEGKGYAEGYQEGVFAGGERLLEERLPFNLLIPNLTLEEVLSAGVEALRPRGIPLPGPDGVYEEIERMLSERQPYSLVRLGDGELLTLAQDIVLPAEEVRKSGHFLSYAGVDVPDLRARDELMAAIPMASRIGVPLSRRPHFQPLLFAWWKACGIQAESLPLTFSTVNYALYEQGYMTRLMAGRRVLLIGNVAEPLARVLLAQGVWVVGTVHPVQGMDDVYRVLEEAAAYDFDLALVSAGIAAVPICVHLARRTGKAAIDFGHQANILAGVRGSPVRREGPNNRR